MDGDVAVALLDGRSLAVGLAERTGLEVTATISDDHLDVAERLGADGALVVGLASVPWPTLPDLHAHGSATLPAYTGVVSWHALPELHERLAQAVAPAAAAGAHVLFTAPDPGPDTDPADVMFLPEVAEAVTGRLQLTARSVAWRGQERAPTAVAALAALVDAHGRRDVVECPVAPGTSADQDLQREADRLQVRMSCADLGRSTQLDLLARVVATVVGHEGLD